MLFRLIFRYLKAKGKLYWFCDRCREMIDDNDKKCKCVKGPSPWHLCFTP